MNQFVAPWLHTDGYRQILGHGGKDNKLHKNARAVGLYFYDMKTTLGDALIGIYGLLNNLKTSM